MSVNSAFAFGLLIPTLRKYGLFQPAIAMLGVGLLLVSASFPFGINRWIASVGALFLVGLVASHDAASRRVDGRFARLADRYGDWSYALYLCHAPLLIAIYLKHPPLPNWTLWLLAVVGPLVIAAPYGVLDLFLYGHLKRWSDRMPRVVNVSLASVYTLCFLAISAYAASGGLKASQPDKPAVSSPTNVGVETR